MTSHMLLPDAPSHSEWPGPPRTSKWPRLAAYWLATVLLAVVSYQYVLNWQQIVELRAVQLHIWAEMPEAGGWRGDMLRIPSGRTVELTVHGVSDVHTFALAYTEVESRRDLGPGDEETVTFVTPAPGRYVLHSTTWCSPNHWRMRTIIEIYDPTDEEVSLAYPQVPARYPITVDFRDLEMPHFADMWPKKKPDAAAGAAIWAEHALDISPAALLAEFAWPNVTPQAIYASLQRDNLANGVTVRASDDELWALVAHLRQEASIAQIREQGRALYQQNCAACHGDQGRGDGFAAPLSVGQEPDFTEFRATAGASPALYYAKIARGGMGTGMPNWGTILTEDELCALVDYIQTFSYTPTLEGK